MRSSRNEVAKIHTIEPPKEVGRAILIKTEGDVDIYIPTSTVHEIHPDYIICDRWIAIKKGLVE